jgi:hypothetical protein
MLPSANPNSALRERLVTPVAEGCVLRVLAVAEPDLLLLGQRELLRAKAGAFVAAIAHRLVARESARAPEVISGLEFNCNGLLVVDFWEVAHAQTVPPGPSSFKDQS